MNHKFAKGNLLFALLSAGASSVQGGQKGFQVITFGGSSHWQATQTILFRGASGRLATHEVGSVMLGRRCASYLAQFQEFPLREMLDWKYITRDTYERARTELPRQLDARQLLLITPFEDLATDAAARAFEGKIPSDRVLSRPLGAKEGVTRIAEGTLYIVRGQILSRERGLVPVRVPWELNVNREKSANPLNREHLPLLFEFGRLAMMPLQQDASPIDQTMQLAFTVLETEVELLGFTAEDAVVTSQFFDRAHHKLFLRQWPLRPLTPDQRALLERDPRAATSRVRVNTEPDSEGVVFGSLAEVLAPFKGREISELATRIAAASGGRVTGQRAKNFASRLMSALRQNFDFLGPDGAFSPRGPIQVRDRGTSLVDAAVTQIIREEVGIIVADSKTPPPELIPIKRVVDGLYWNPEPDWLANGWVDPSYFVTREALQKRQTPPALEVSNLDPVVAHQYPILYEASLILALFDQVRSQGQDPGVVFEQTPLRIASSDLEIANHLRLLGGRPVDAEVVQMRFMETASEVSLSLGKFAGHFFDFRPDTVAEISRQFPQLNENSRERLRPGTHAVRLRFLNSPYQ